MPKSVCAMVIMILVCGPIEFCLVLYSLVQVNTSVLRIGLGYLVGFFILNEVFLWLIIKLYCRSLGWGRQRNKFSKTLICNLYFSEYNKRNNLIDQ